MGEYDVVKAVLSRIADMRWMQIAIKPAKPFAFGLLASGDKRTPVFGLPGNPVSSMVSFELFARPALRKMMGHTAIDRPTVRAVADDGLARRSRRQDPLHAGRRRVRPRRPLHIEPSGPKEATSWRPRLWPTPLPSFPTAMASNRAAPSTRCSSR